LYTLESKTSNQMTNFHKRVYISWALQNVPVDTRYESCVQTSTTYQIMQGVALISKFENIKYRLRSSGSRLQGILFVDLICKIQNVGNVEFH